MTERFKRTLFGGGAKSTDGYQVRFNNRSSIEYRDASGVVLVGAEGLATRGFAFYPEQMSVGSGAPPIDDPGFRALVIARVRKVSDFLGTPLE